MWLVDDGRLEYKRGKVEVREPRKRKGYEGLLERQPPLLVVPPATSFQSSTNLQPRSKAVLTCNLVTK